VARLAGLRKTAAVGITVAVRALAEGNSRVTRFVVGAGCVALCAGHRGVQAGQGILGLRMVKLPHRDRLPIAVAMALRAILAEASLVLILVTSHATGRQPQKSPVQILDLDLRTRGRRNSRGSVAALASQPRMFAFQRVTSLPVLEGLHIPLDEREIFPVMLGVAAAAFLAGGGREVIGSV